MRLRAPWPTSLGGRTVLVLLAAVIVVHLGSMLAYRDSAMDAASEAHTAQVAGRLATALRAVAERPSAERDATAHELSSDGLTLRWDPRPITDKDSATDPGLRGLARAIEVASPGLQTADLRLAYGDYRPAGDAHGVLGALRLADGSWLSFSIPVVTGMGPSFHGALLSTSVMAAGVILVAVLLVRTLVAPLRELARAADEIGRGPEVVVPESGPDEVRQVSRAFNAMQARIHALISDRTQALAAVSHDLRTPITRLRLRAGFLADQEAQAAIDADLDEMEAMIDATLAYLRGDVEPDGPKPTDVSAILATLVDAAADAGRPATFHGPQHAFASLRGLAMKRAFANVIDNALTYGGAARVTLRDSGATLLVTVDDDGPGIPDAELDRVFEPFHRLEASRNRQTGGVGLGLAIVRQAVTREGGTVRLANRAEGGLRAEISIPRRAGGADAGPRVAAGGKASLTPAA
ncbi:MAG: HAMP domain-containing sensor histidine kinase [Acetobacteraceae bacterium]